MVIRRGFSSPKAFPTNRVGVLDFWRRAHVPWVSAELSEHAEVYERACCAPPLNRKREKRFTTAREKLIQSNNNMYMERQTER